MEKAEIFNAFFALVLTDNSKSLRPEEKVWSKEDLNLAWEDEVSEH